MGSSREGDGLGASSKAAQPAHAPALRVPELEQLLNNDPRGGRVPEATPCDTRRRVAPRV